MRAATLIIAAAVLAFSPMALAQTETPAAETAPAVEAVVAPPADEPAAPVEGAAPAADEGASTLVEPQRVCHTIERSESRLRSRRERICRTQAEWDALQQQRNGRSGAQADSN
jgi:hypothetical protein